jgi:uncharacterized phage infection (PIP) family protein YhgE
MLQQFFIHVISNVWALFTVIMMVLYNLTKSAAFMVQSSHSLVFALALFNANGIITLPLRDEDLHISNDLLFVVFASLSSTSVSSLFLVSGLDPSLGLK